MPIGRIRRLELLSRLGSKALGRVMEGTSRPRYKGQDEIMLKINNQKNAVNSLNAFRNGKITGSAETPESIARKLNGELKLYSGMIKSNLEVLGYGKIVETRGIEKALEQCFNEMNAAKARQKK